MRGGIVEALQNEDNIRAWDAFSQSMIDVVGDEGDAARRLLLNPALFDFIGDPRSRTILDAGSGTGYLSRLLARRGAQVTGVEPAPSLYAYATMRERHESLGIRYIAADLSALPTSIGLFDCVVANMVLMDIPDYQPAMHACVGAVKPGGAFIFSLLHPCFDEVDNPDVPRGYSAKGYIRVEEYLNEFVVPQSVGYYVHRPLSAYLNVIIDAGCRIRRVVEPTLTPDGVAELGAGNRNTRVPNFIVIHAERG
jgi:2-polyprenyl-3-methyl-5-hydroxy-6-metoxy-1,4-benzoquinol methylase